MTSELHVQIFSCGGTIDKIYFDAKSEYEVGSPQIDAVFKEAGVTFDYSCLLYTSPSPRDRTRSRMPSSA